MKKCQQAARGLVIVGAAGLFALTATVSTGIDWPHPGRSTEAAALDIDWPSPTEQQLDPTHSPTDIDWPSPTEQQLHSVDLPIDIDWP